jgi:prepilin-type N-terminal cleavage/methylation domain-containing protein
MREKNKDGFTLVELLVVIAIIALLSMLAITTVNYARAYAKENKTKHDIAQLAEVIRVLAYDTEQWPGHQSVNQVCSSCGNNEICGPDEGGGNCLNRSISDGISGIEKNDSVTPYSNWGGPYIQKIPLDPWGHEYFFDTDYEINVDDEPCNGSGSCITAVVIGSYGPDGIGNNQYNGDDIIKILVK